MASNLNGGTADSSAPVRGRWRRRRILAIAGVLATLGFILAVWLLGSREVELQGRPLTAWLADLGPNIGPAADRAREVLRQEGVETARLVTRALRRERTLSVKFYFKIGQRLPRFLSAPLSRVIRPYDGVQVRRGAAAAIGLLKELPEGCIPELVRALGDEDYTVRERCMESFVRFGREGGVEVGRFLATASESECGTALSLLRRMGTNAVPAIPTMVSLLSKGTGQVPGQAAWVLAAQGGAAVSPLLDAMGHGDEEARQRAANTLTSLCSADLNGFVVLTNRLGILPPSVRMRLPGVLVAIEPPMKRFYVATARLLCDEDPGVRRAASEGLHQRIDRAQLGMAGLLEALDRGEKAETRRLAAGLLKELDCSKPELAPVLTAYQEDPDSEVRAAVEAALGANVLKKKKAGE